MVGCSSSAAPIPANRTPSSCPTCSCSVLAPSAVSLRDVELFAVAVGPGSFTGLRIGIATMQGFATVAGRRLVGISALEALAQIAAEGEPTGRVVGVWIDGQRGEVFSALYRTADAPAWSPCRLVEIEGASVGEPAPTLARWETMVEVPAARFVGNGVVRYVSIVRTRVRVDDVPEPWPLAGAIGRMAAGRVDEAGEPGAVRPLYVASARRGAGSGQPRAAMSEWIVAPLATPADLDSVLAIEEASFTNPWTREMYLADLEHEGVSYCYVARQDSGPIVGYCSFWLVVDEIHLNNLAVDPAHRRGGAAMALLSAVIRDGMQRGARLVRLEVRRSNDARAAVVRATRLQSGGRAPRLLHQAGRRCAGARQRA